VKPEIKSLRVTDTERTKEYEVSAAQAQVFGTLQDSFSANGASQDNPVTKS
jgi:hypothetical protein